MWATPQPLQSCEQAASFRRPGQGPRTPRRSSLLVSRSWRLFYPLRARNSRWNRVWRSVQKHGIDDMVRVDAPLEGNKSPAFQNNFRFNVVGDPSRLSRIHVVQVYPGTFRRVVRTPARPVDESKEGNVVGVKDRTGATVASVGEEVRLSSRIIRPDCDHARRI